MGGEPGGADREEPSVLNRIEGVGVLAGESDRMIWSTRRSILYRCVPKIEPVFARMLVGRLGGPVSSPSSLISWSWSRLDEVEGEAVWRGNEAAREVSFRSSAVAISSRFSKGE